ncbi:MAG: plasmid pRiA4b ORF-3 family protein [Bacteroidaceae bacterium]|nr:plasmid pRiA4b ORF-3 family protein [Bacteroidaceae bacterium]
MAKKIKFNPTSGKEKPDMADILQEAMASLPQEMKEDLEKHGVKTFDDLLGLMLDYGIDPVKMMDYSMKHGTFPDDFNPEDVMLDEDDYDDAEEDFDDDEFDDTDGFDDEEYLLGLRLPKAKFIGKPKREFHIRIKLNNAPVKIWRELVVPSNITLELLAYVLLDAMGWRHEHLYQFVGKHDTYYLNSHQMKEEMSGPFAFLGRAQYRNSEKTTLEMVLQSKNERLRFEYDFGDSWTHELWVKGERDYAPGEEPVIKLLKGQGACPPEDCGGVWGYADLLELSKKARKTADEKERLEWYDIPKDYDPDDCDLEWLQEDVEALWEQVKEEKA